MRPVPTRRLAVVLAALAIAVVLAPLPQPATAWLACAVLVVLCCVDLLLAPAPGKVAVTRALPSVLSLGRPGRLVWHVDNPRRRPLTLALADTLAPSLQAPQRRVRVRVPARSSASVDVALRPQRRGTFALSELVVRVEGPLGLFARQRARTSDAVLKVYPSFASRDEAELRIDKARILEVGLRSAKGLGSGTEFEQLREYGIDDDSRRIDWAATARTQRPIVRTYRAERNQTVLNLLDNGRVMAGTVAGVARVEHAMDAVMMLTTVATRLGDRSGLVVFDREVRTVVAPSHAARQLGVVVDAMFDLEPQLVASDYRAAFEATLTRFRRRAMLVLYTDLADSSIVGALGPALRLVAHRHLVAVASVQDPLVVGWANGPVVDDEAAYRKAAALAALDQRRQAVRQLQALGVRVVDSPPGRLAPDLADLYIDAKARGRL